MFCIASRLRLGGEQSGDGPSVVVDAEAAQIGVADIREQPLVSSLGGLLQARMDLLDRYLVAGPRRRQVPG